MPGIALNTNGYEDTSKNNVQGLHSRTWTAPPIDGTLTVPEMFDFHLDHSPDHPFFVYHNLHGGGTTSISFAEVAMAVHRVAASILSLAGNNSSGRKVIAILGVSDSITYALLIIGVMRAGHVPFPISPRNSAPIVTHLLNKTSASHLFVSDDPAMQALAAAGTKELNYTGLKLLPMPVFETLFPANNDDFTPLSPMTGATLDDLALILHSSGSTAYPKPIFIKHRWILQQAVLPWSGEMDFCGQISALHSIPMFHFSGAIQPWWCAATGLTLAVLPPARPPVLSTPDIAFEGVVKTKSTIIYGISVHIEEWSRDPAKIDHMKTLKAVIFQGAPLEKHTGQKLAKAGVPLLPIYGCTEAGGVTCVLPAKPIGEDFDWFAFGSHIKTAFIPQDEPGVFELVVVQTRNNYLNVINTTVQGQDAYATSDLLLHHPTKPHLWRVHGRADDQITLSTGEKVNPAPLELMLTKNPSISSALMFGRAKFNTGVLIEPKHPFDPSDEAALAAFRNDIWSTVENVNSFAPSHARLFKEMILVLKPSKPFEYTPKGSPRRQAVISKYSEEIEEAYRLVESSSQEEIITPVVWNFAQIHILLRSILERVLKAEIGDNDDIFTHGCDSLQATYIRNSILRAIRKSHPLVTRNFPVDFVYKHPTIRRLVELIKVKVDGTEEGSSEQSTIEQIETTIKELTEDFPIHHEANNHYHLQNRSYHSKDVVLLTGSTGALGANILAELLLNKRVSRVYALNRPSSQKTLRKRQASSFEDRGIEQSLLNSDKLVLLEGVTSEHHLGLPDGLYSEIRDSVTHVIHNAWPVNFNYTLLSFQQTFKGLRNLIDMCLQSSGSLPRFVFVSSIAVVRNYDGPLPVPESPEPDPKLAIGFGYGESKLVAERVLDRVKALTSLPVTVVRVGQLSGGVNGAWNTKEWFPAMVKSGQMVGCLPQVDAPITWVPLRKAARALVEMRDSVNTPLHLVHPSPVEWSSILAPISKILGLPVVSYSHWLNALEEYASTTSDAHKNPALRLLNFYRGAEGKHDAFAQVPVLSVQNAMRASPALASLQVFKIGEKDAKSWVSYWRRIGFIE